MGTNPQIDQNLASYIFGQTGIPTAYTNGLQDLGFLGEPFGGVQANFQAEQQFQRMIKNIMDTQMKSFNFASPDINALPYNMRSLFNAAAPLLTDPLYGIEGANGMLSHGYAYGDLPNNPTRAWDVWQSQQHTPYSPVQSGYPSFAPPNISAFAAPSSQSPAGTTANAGGGGGGGGGGQSSRGQIGSYTVPLQGGGSMTVNANSPQAAQINANQGGNKADTSQPVTTNRASTLTG
jgi:hypothetical protein